MLTKKQVKALKVGDRIHWEYTGPDADDAEDPSDGTVIETNYMGVQIMWDDDTGCMGRHDEVEFWKHVTLLPTTPETLPQEKAR